MIQNQDHMSSKIKVQVKQSLEYADNKDFLVQSIARYETLRTQSCVLVMPGNAEICAGDQIDIRLVNKVPGEEAKSENWDNESSGVYLIEEVTHQYDNIFWHKWSVLYYTQIDA